MVPHLSLFHLEAKAFWQLAVTHKSTLHYAAERNNCPILENRKVEEILASFPACLVDACMDTKKATYDSDFKKCREPVTPTERLPLISVQPFLLQEEFRMYAVMLA